MDKEELLDLIEEIKLKLPDDIKQAKWVKEERQRIIEEANREAGAIIKQAEDKIISMVDDHEITKRAAEQANTILDNAHKQKTEIRRSTISYAEGVLSNLESALFDAAQRSQDCLSEVRQNKKELAGKDE